MADKMVIIDGVTLKNGQEVKSSRETKTSTTTTFDGVIPQGTDVTSFKLEIGRVSYEGLSDYKTIHETLTRMLKQGGMITVIENKYPPGDEQNFKITRNYYNCLVDGDEYTIKPEEHTVESLKFTCSRMEEKVDYI